jgi:EAL domain-containing protein (putative c-di-GMP-specific phosphodiesterase class I)
LGLKVIAEGVECHDIWEMLKNLGCDKAQGYYICKPLPAEEFMRWMDEAKWGLERKDTPVQSRE